MPLKKLHCILLILVSSVSISTIAQTKQIGIIIGTSLPATQTGRHLNSDAFLSPYYPMVGIYYQKNIFNWVSANATLFYVPKSSRHNILVPNESYNPENPISYEYISYFETCRLNYISAPIELVLLPNRKINFIGGIEPAFLLGNQFMNNITEDRYDYHRFEFSVRYGIQLSAWKTKLQCVYSRSVTPKYESMFNKAYNQYLQVSVQIPLKLK